MTPPVDHSNCKLECSTTNNTINTNDNTFHTNNNNNYNNNNTSNNNTFKNNNNNIDHSNSNYNIFVETGNTKKQRVSATTLQTQNLGHILMTCKRQTDVRRIDVEPVDVGACRPNRRRHRRFGHSSARRTWRRTEPRPGNVTTPQTVGASTTVALGIVPFKPQTRVGPHITVNVVLIATWTK